ncbi:multicopper oxidase-domain-containing protein [Kickxella alabastrina]|uniref:multicopper oxidase-domain-containing protein n=1 Tax=Kickxella alabastrina TaxID=61397 RepID=UPI002221182F|nr:multicopper oxidase-domain-containing protein [Kickxella alabastrina]KAI7821613.1 multicopper oxidase-domain-containing protein [Kickxella alabastrina]
MRLLSPSLLPSAAALALLMAAHAKQVYEYWDIGYLITNRGIPNLESKKAIGVNNHFPLPVVRADKGDTLILNVHNSLDVGTSLHAHGLFQRGTNYYDGVPMTTACPIAPGTNFTYYIPLDQAGTYWIHGHSKEQNFDGLRTPLIINEPEDPHNKIDEEFLFTFEDWWPITFEQSMDIIAAPHGLEYIFGKLPGALINGYDGALARPLAFQPGKTYRIRLVNMASMPEAEFVIDDHDLQIIEVDGVRTKPKTVKVVRLAPGQRLSVLVKAKPSSNLNYNYHITIMGDYLPSIPGIFPITHTSPIIYNNKSTEFAPTAMPLASEPFDDINIESLEYLPALIADRSLFLNLTSGFTENEYSHRESINFKVYRDPIVPTMFTALTTPDSMAINPITYGPQTSAHVLKYDEVIEVLLWSPTERPHPIHLHGHVFQVIERGSVKDKTGAARKIVPQHIAGYSPLMRDTVMVDVGNYVVIRFRADNPGVWNLHCHFDWHMGQGMNMLFVEAPKQMKEILKVPEQIAEQCRRQGIPVEGNVVGRTTYNYDGAPDLPHLHLTSPFV